MPMEKRGGAGLLMVTFSGLCVPGPGFPVESNRNNENNNYIQFPNQFLCIELIQIPIHSVVCLSLLFQINE